MLRDPDLLPADCSAAAGGLAAACELRLVVGPVYETAAGDRLGDVAARYRTTVTERGAGGRGGGRGGAGD